MIEIIINAFPPSVNRLHGGVCRSQRFYLTKEQKAFRAIVAEAVGSRRIDSEAVEVDITLFPKDRRRRDIDNYTKGLFDGLTACKFWSDDSIVKRLSISWGAVGEAKTIVKVKEYEERQAET